MIMTITLPNSEEVEVSVTETIRKKDSSFFLFEGYHKASGEKVEVRVETKENYEDRKSRSC